MGLLKSISRSGYLRRTLALTILGIALTDYADSRVN
jgi:hypothetical protein